MLDLRSKARQQLLAYYFTNPTARHHLRDLAERLGIDPSNLSKELGRLERDGLFRSEVIGRQKYFQLNREYPLFDEVRKIVAKTIGAAPVIAQSLKTGYSGEGEHRFRREAERHSGAKVNSSRSEATLAW
jgi:DNA-binding MarR family transcriptional regulator